MRRSFGVFYIVERPAVEGIPEVIRIFDEDPDNHLLVYFSSDDEEAERDVVIVEDDAEGIPPVSSEDEDSDDSDNWSDWFESSVDSGYESMFSELEEDDDNGDGPDGDEESEGEVEEFTIYDDNLQPADMADIPPPDVSPENSSPSPCIPTASTRKSMDGIHEEPHPVKRQKTHNNSPTEEPCSNDPAPSTSGFHISNKRCRDECWEGQAKRQCFCDDSDSD
ncbi:hypothetical protein EXN66_Car000914 [Channa argus]|uniref:Uncharacterized protein n=1 Tax=Channa argus TaxID=215402 RepID=A0A6G1QYG1_CHAAH|nr:hypothetical protein EXN66_Car000914 [Channa argus]